jgi:hypothetical protein
MKLRLTIVGCLLLVLGGFGWWLYAHFDYVYHDQTLPQRGQASYDPLYAASLTLRAYGVTTQVGPYLDFQGLKPVGDDTLIYYGDIRALTSTQVWQLDRFVIQLGGHLLVQLPRDPNLGDIPLLDAFNLHTVTHVACNSYGVDPGDRKDSVALCGPNAIQGSAADFDYAAGKDGRLQYVQYSQGKGWIAVVSDMHFMSNLPLKEPAAQALMLRILQPQPGHGRMLLIYSMDSEGLPLLLLRYGWPVLLPLLLCLIALLWRVTPRFGPSLPTAAEPRRAMLEHVHADGEFLWREGQARTLLEAVRADMLLTLRRRHPAASRSKSRELLDSLTAITGLPRVQVRRALAQDSSDVKEDFTQRISTLIDIRKHL